MNDRDRILSAIRESLSELPDKTPRPEYDRSRLVAERRLPDRDLWSSFRINFKAVRGTWCESPQAMTEFLLEQKLQRGFCDPRLRDRVGTVLEQAGLQVEYECHRETIDELEFGITWASGAIAETGTLILNDRETTSRLAAVAPWVHVAVVQEDRIFRSISDALANLGDDPNIIWVTGPSKTADVEGILIEGVHGPGEQLCLTLPADG